MAQERSRVFARVPFAGSWDEVVARIRPMGTRVLPVGLLFFLSGSSALIYEVLWARQLGLVFGTTAQATSTVLAAFMLGLALGAAVGGRWADRAINPLRLFGIIEIGIGAAGVVVPRMINGLPSLYLPLAGSEGGTGAVLLLVRFGLGLAVLLVPTILMGASFPALVRVVGARADKLGWLYAANTLGAVVGTISAGYLIIPRLGITGTTGAAATLNFTVGFLALLQARTEATSASSAPVSHLAERRSRRVPPHTLLFPRAVPLAILAFSGATTLATQILWNRILVFPLLSTTYAFATVLAAFLAGLAFGGALAARWLAAAQRPWLVIAWLQGLLGLALLIPVVAIGPVTSAFTTLQGWALEQRWLLIASHMTAVFLLLLPQTVVAGAAYPLLLRAAVSESDQVGRAVGRGLLLNSLGAAVAATATAQWGIPAFGILPMFAVLAALGLGLAVALGVHAYGGSQIVGSICGTAAALEVAALAWGPLAATRPNPFESLAGLYDGQGPRVVAYREGAESTLAVIELSNALRALRINGFEAAGVRGDLYGYMRLMAHLPLLLHPRPTDALVISFGTGTTAGAAARHPLTRLDLVDLDPEVFAHADHFAAVNRRVLSDPRVHVIVNDGRNFLALTERRYDVITLEPMPPTFAGMVNLYSREFYSMARAHLRPEGILCQWVPFHLMSLAESQAVLRTFVEVFPQSSLWMHRGSGFVIGTAGGRLAVDAARLEAGLGEPGIREDLKPVGAGELIPLLNLLVWGPETLRAATASASLVTDDNPTLDFPEVPFRVSERSTLPAVRVWQAQEMIYDRRQAAPPAILNLPPERAAELAETRKDFDLATIGGAALELGHLDRADTMFRARAAGCRTDQCRAQAAFRMGLLAERRGDLPAARRHLRDADRLEPGRETIRRALRRLDADRQP